jgi:polyisoprenoid-binding protein YceI
MKYLLFLFVVLAIASCENKGTKNTDPAREVAESTDKSEIYTVDPNSSQIGWKASKRTETVHMGTVSIKEGSLSFLEGKLIAGYFHADMTSMKNTDLTDPKKNATLMGHLKSADFFHVDSFPTASFELTGAEALSGGTSTHKVSGNLTIKGISRNVTFPATVNKTDDKVSAQAVFEINRNDWGITWGGSKETRKSIKEKLGDNLIKDMIELNISLTAVK